MENFEAEHWIFMFMFILAIVLFVVWSMFGDKCPKCGRMHAMKTTGQKEKKETKGFFFERDLYELQCKYCGHCIWKKDYSGGDEAPDPPDFD